jgi:hypothetical protein
MSKLLDNVCLSCPEKSEAWKFECNKECPIFRVKNNLQEDKKGA